MSQQECDNGLFGVYTEIGRIRDSKAGIDAPDDAPPAPDRQGARSLAPVAVRPVLLLALASACAAADDYDPYDPSEPNSKVMEEVDEMTDERSVGLILRGAMADDSAYTVLAAMCKPPREATVIGIADGTDEPPPSEQLLVRLDDEPAYRRVRSAFDLDFVRTLLLYDRLRVRDNNHTYHFDLAAARSDIVDFLKRCRGLRAARASAAPPPQ